MPDWAGPVGGWIGLVVFLGAVVAYLRGSRDKGTIATLESSNQSLLQWQAVAKGEIADLKADATATAIKHKAEVDALNLRMTAVEHENADLRAQRPSAEAIEAVHSLLLAVHSDTRKLVAAMGDAA
jgi:cell division protein FtsB